jgi:hypothetical protein
MTQGSTRELRKDCTADNMVSSSMSAMMKWWGLSYSSIVSLEHVSHHF